MCRLCRLCRLCGDCGCILCVCPHMYRVPQEEAKTDNVFPIKPLMSPHTIGKNHWDNGWTATMLLVFTCATITLLWVTHFVMKG